MRHRSISLIKIRTIYRWCGINLVDQRCICWWTEKKLKRTRWFGPATPSTIHFVPTVSPLENWIQLNCKYGVRCTLTQFHLVKSPAESEYDVYPITNEQVAKAIETVKDAAKDIGLNYDTYLQIVSKYAECSKIGPHYVCNNCDSCDAEDSIKSGDTNEEWSHEYCAGSNGLFSSADFPAFHTSFHIFRIKVLN